MFNLKAHRDGQEGTPDLLNWAALVDDGVMLNKDGSFSAAWLYSGLDVDTATHRDRNNHANRINQALSSLGTGWMVHVDSIRTLTSSYSPREASHFPHPVMQLVDESRRLFFESQGDKFQGKRVLVVTYRPPVKSLSKVTDLLFEDTRGKPGIASTNLARFKEKLVDIEGRLASTLSMSRLSAYKKDGVWYDELLSYLHFTLTGKWHPVRMPVSPLGLDSLLGACDFWPGFLPKVNDQYISIISIDDFPDASSPNILYALDITNVEYRWSTRFIFLDDREAMGLLEKERKKWQQKVVSFKDKLTKNPNPKIDGDALGMLNYYEQAKTALSSGQLHYGHYTTTLILRHTDQSVLAEMTEYVTKTLNNLAGFTCRVESVNATEALLGSLPTDSIHNIRRPLLSTDNLTHLLPTASIWTGEAHCPCPFYPENSPPLMVCTATGNTPYRLNLHVDDVGHTLILGPTGAGKSTLLATLAMQLFRYPKMQGFAFDKGNSLYAVSQLGGVHMDIGGDKKSQSAFAPLSALNDDFEWCCDYIEKLVILQGLQVTPTHRRAIHHALSAMRSSQLLTLSEFRSQCQDEEVKEAIEYYTVKGRSGDLLDAQSDTLDLQHFMVFEIDTLMARGDKDIIAVLSYLFRRIERHLTGQPAFIILDEAWVVFHHPVFKSMLREWLKVLRKANCMVILATQSLTDAIKSGMLDVLIESCLTQIFLPNDRADLFSDTYHQFGLNDKQIALLKQSQRKRDYYVCQPNGNRLIQLNLDKLALSFVGASDKEAISHIRNLVMTEGDNWYLSWMKHNGLDFATKEKLCA